MRLILALILSLIMMSSTAMAQISPEKKALILKFLDISGTPRSLSESLDTLINNLPPDQANVGEKMRKRIKINEIIQQLIPVYDRYFTTEELQGFVNFYSSPLGMAFIQKIPLVMKESIGISTKYMKSKLEP